MNESLKQIPTATISTTKNIFNTCSSLGIFQHKFSTLLPCKQKNLETHFHNLDDKLDNNELQRKKKLNGASWELNPGPLACL